MLSGGGGNGNGGNTCAIIPKIQGLFLYNNNRCDSRSLVFKSVCWNRSSLFFTFSRSVAMAQPDEINSSPEIKEPSPKVPKLGQNGVTQGPVSLLKVKKLSEKAVLPSRGSALAAGYDLSRSGLSWKHSLDVGAGVIDADYRGPLGVILFNHSDVDFEVKVGDRIAQLILEKMMTPDVLEVEDLDATSRGDGGFGSTGV